MIAPANIPPLLELKGITKRFPGVLALSNVSFSVGQAEVVALIGENGAGKSTLMKTLGGVHQPDEGDIFFDGKKVAITKVADAIALGIGFVHQELNVLDNLDVAANIFLGREPLVGGPLRLVDQRRMWTESEIYLRRLGLAISPKKSVGELSIAQQQMVEIAKALSQKARVIIMDEPTSSLTLSETDRLLATVKELRTAGVSVIYISHRLGEIEQIADRAVALRDGRNAGELARADIKHEKMVSLMVGRKLEDLFVKGKGPQELGYVQVEGLRTPYRPHHRISFNVARGEILGFAGLVGAGRSEMAQALFGVEPRLEGVVRLGGKELQIRNAREGIAAGIFLVPEDRRHTGLVTSMTIRENITLPGLKQCSTYSLISHVREVDVSNRQVASLKVKTPSIETRAMNLSGGNQQKVVLGKWLSLTPKLMIFDEPTRGIDVGAKAEIYRLMRELADRGVAIIMISSDMEEVLGVSDRVAVMHEGDITGFLLREQFTEKAIMHLATGRKAP
jgi:ribose transport system ATP-binding protein